MCSYFIKTSMRWLGWNLQWKRWSQAHYYTTPHCHWSYECVNNVKMARFLSLCYRCFRLGDFCGDRLFDFLVFGSLFSDPSSEKLAGTVMLSCGEGLFLRERVMGPSASSSACSVLAMISARLSSDVSAASGIVGNENAATFTSVPCEFSGKSVTTVAGKVGVSSLPDLAKGAARPVVARSTVMVSMSSVIPDSLGRSTTSGSVER